MPSNVPSGDCTFQELYCTFQKRYFPEAVIRNCTQKAYLKEGDVGPMPSTFTSSTVRFALATFLELSRELFTALSRAVISPTNTSPTGITPWDPLEAAPGLTRELGAEGRPLREPQHSPWTVS